MKTDFIIRNGRIFDSRTATFYTGDIAIKGSKIEQTGDLAGYSAPLEYDAAGKLVVPGLIDFHLHMFTKASDEGVPADLALLPYGVTSAVEGGSAGVATWEAFQYIDCRSSMVSMKANLNVSSLGILSGRQYENLKPEYFEEDRILECVRRHRESLFGLKLRYSLDMDPHIPLETLDRCLALAEQAGLPLVVHVTNPPVPLEEIAGKLRPGDVFCHCFHARGDTIIGPDGRVKPGIWDAKRRGVLFDACNGSSNYSHAVALQAIREGFYPDFISTDLSHVFHSYLKPRCFALPYLMSKYMALGMPLEEILRRTTLGPAQTAGWPEKGRLEAGCDADIAVFKLAERPVDFYDGDGQCVRGEYLLVPQMTVKAGTIVYRQLEDCV